MMAAAAAGLSYGALKLDALVEPKTIEKLGWLYTFGPEGARAVLSTVASSMITVAGLTFSITMLTIQLASNQFGPRLLRNVMRDRSTQSVLGIFVSTFIYCLLVLRTVRGVDGASTVPHLSVALGVFLALISLGMLIFFIHHIARSLRLETVLVQLTEEAKRSIEHLYPERAGHSPQKSPEPGNIAGFGIVQGPECALTSEQSGYIQKVDLTALIHLASDYDLFVEIHSRPGDFVVAGQMIAAVQPAARCSPNLLGEVRQCFAVGDDRTPDQDIEHTSGRVVEIAQRALSPGVNDPTTALYCADRLREILLHLAQREIPSALRLDHSGRPRILAIPHDQDALASKMLADILRYGASEPAILSKIAAISGEIQSLMGAERTPGLTSLRSSILNCHSDLELEFDKRITLDRSQ